MRKLIAAMNITLDGYCDHTYGVVSEQMHKHYAELLDSAGVILYGRITYQLMQYWQTVLEKPADDKGTNDFALAIDRVPKIVFSRTLKETGWNTATLAGKGFEEEVLALKQQQGQDIFVGSPSLIAAGTRLNLIDEYQLCIHPVIAGKGLSLFKEISGEIMLQLLRTKTFDSGAVVHYYQNAITPA